MAELRRWSVIFAVVLVSFCGLVSTATADTAVSEESEATETNEEPAEGAGFDRLGVEEPTGLARAELVGFQTIHGIVAGVELCVIVDCQSARAGLSAVTLGAATGLGASLLATHETGITPGQASALNSGVLWGGWLGLMASDLAGTDGRGVAGTMLVGQLGGMGLGYGLSNLTGATAGDVGLVNQSGLWAGIFYTIIRDGVLEANVSREAGRVGLMMTAVAGGVGGGALASQVPMSRGRVTVTSASGLLGGLVGAAVPVLAVGDDVNSQVVATGVTLGAAGGLLTAGYLTRTWDGDEYRPESAALGIQPTVDGEGMLGTLSGRF